MHQKSVQETENTLEKKKKTYMTFYDRYSLLLPFVLAVEVRAGASMELTFAE